MITTTITMAAATALVRSDRSFLSEIGGFISITPNLANPLLYRLNCVKRNCNSTMKMTVENFEAAKQQFLDIKAVVEMEDILPELVFSWYLMVTSNVPGSLWTMEVKGSKQVEIAG